MDIDDPMLDPLEEEKDPETATGDGLGDDDDEEEGAKGVASVWDVGDDMVEGVI